MMPTPHILFGAALGTRVRRTWLVVPGAIASHYLLDWVPHLDSSSLRGLGHGTFWVVWTAVLDFFVAWIVLAALSRRYRLPASSWWAAGAAILPDIVQWVPGIRNLFGTNGPFLAVGLFHHGFHHSLELGGWLLGLGTQVAIVLLSLYAIVRQPPDAPAPSTASPTEAPRDAAD